MSSWERDLLGYNIDIAMGRETVYELMIAPPPPPISLPPPPPSWERDLLEYNIDIAMGRETVYELMIAPPPPPISLSPPPPQLQLLAFQATNTLSHVNIENKIHLMTKHTY